jgi:hypothetical protein
VFRRTSPKTTTTRISPPAFRRGLRLEWLEGRDVPATFFVDDGLVVGANIATLNGTTPGYQVIDQNADNLLNDGDIVRLTLPGQSSTTDLTFQGTATGTTDLRAFGSITQALAAAAAVTGTTDTVLLGAGTYTESVVVNTPVNLSGITGVATAVVLDPATNTDNAVTVSADGVTLSNLVITGGANGVQATTGVTNLTLTNVTVGDNPATATVESNTGVGLNLTGTGTGTLTLTNVTLAGNTTQGFNISGFSTVSTTGLNATAGTTQSTIDLGAATANATLNLTTGAAGGTTTVTGTSVQFGTGETISLANVDALNLIGGTGADTFVVTAPTTASGTTITIAGGTGSATDVIDLPTAAGQTVNATFGTNGFSGTIAAAGSTTINFSGVESFADGSTITGTVFTDADNSGTQNGTETGLGGVTAFLDANGNNQLDPGELRTTTNAAGTYTFAGLPPGSYSVRVVQNGFNLTTSATPAAVTITTLGQTGLAPVNFGVRQTSGGTVSGVLFGDTNSNGTQGAGETAIQGATVYLDLDGDTQLDANEPRAVTDVNGAFVLTTGSTGTFTLRVAAPLPSGFALPATLPTVQLNGGNSVTQNLGLVPTASGPTGGSVSGTVFADVGTQNGTRDAGENGVRGVTVFLDLDNDGRLDSGEPTSVTDQNGNFTLTTTQNVTNVAVRPVLSPGYLRTTTHPTVTLTAGAAVTGTDIGLITNLPPQATPSRRLAAGFIRGGKNFVKVMGDDGKELFEREVFSGLNIRDVRVAVGDVTGDGVEDVIVGTGPGVPTQVIVLDGTNLQEIARFSPFEAGFTGGLFVAVGDVTGDGINDIIITPDQGGGPRVVVYAGGTGTFTQVASFFGIEDQNFRGGARVSVADVNRDGVPDLIVAAGFGGGPRVAVYNGTSILSGITRLFNDFFVFEQTLRNGVYVTGGDLNGDGFADLVFGGGPGGGPRVLALSGVNLIGGQGAGSTVLANFFAGDDRNRGGVRVVAKDTDGDGRAEIFTGGGEGESGKVHKFRGDGSKDDAFEDDFGGNTGVFVG